MVLMSGFDLPVTAIRSQISSALDLIIHQSRIQDGSRKITYITEVQQMEGNVIVLQDLFRYHQTGFDENGKSQAPSCIQACSRSFSPSSRSTAWTHRRISSAAWPEGDWGRMT